MNLFETIQQSEQFALRFPDPVIAIMLKGKKVMHLRQQDAFEFLPGQSVILNSHEQMVIDFPEAEETKPTRCIGLTLSSDLIHRTVKRADGNDDLSPSQNAGTPSVPRTLRAPGYSPITARS